jgi:hypothetical protein
VDNDYPQQPMDEPEYHGQTHRPNFGRTPKKPKKKLAIIAAIVAVLVLAGGGAAAYMLTHKDKTPAKAATNHTATTPKQPVLPAGVQKVGDKYTFKSTKLNVGVSFPTTWSIRESNDRQEVVLTSPSSPYVKKDGTSAQNVFTVKLRHGIIPDAIKTTVQNGVAVADSEVIAYAQPITDQRQYTNLSYIGPDANNFSFTLVTGYTAYKAGQTVGGGIDLSGETYMFVGGYGADAGDALQFESVPKADYNTAVFKQAVQIIESLQLY